MFFFKTLVKCPLAENPSCSHVVSSVKPERQTILMILRYPAEDAHRCTSHSLFSTECAMEGGIETSPISGEWESRTIDSCSPDIASSSWSVTVLATGAIHSSFFGGKRLELDFPGRMETTYEWIPQNG